jgi:hypothetical protein
LRETTLLPQRSVTLTLTQTSTEVRVTEQRTAGSRKQTKTYLLQPGRTHDLDRYGHVENVTVAWVNGNLVVEAAGKWRETWTVDGNLLKIRRQSLVHQQRARTIVLIRQGTAS